METKVKHKEKTKTKEIESTSMRFNVEICNKIKDEVFNLNKLKKGTKKITASELLKELLPLLNDDCRNRILSKTITSDDRQKVAFSNYKKKYKAITHNDFLDLIQDGEIKINDYLPDEMKKLKPIKKINNIDAA